MVNPSLSNILEGEKITVDDTTHYELSTHEKQAEFAKNRNYTYEVDMNAIMIDALKELNLKVEALRARVEQMERCPWDEWKSNKDIV
jgi:hypothetical protein